MNGRDVALVPLCAAEGGDASLERAAARVLERVGYRVTLGTGRACCGWDAWTQGDIARAQQEAGQWLALAPRAGLLVTLSPRCVHMVRHVYPGLLPPSYRDRLQEVAARLVGWHVPLWERRSSLPSLPSRSVLVFPGCGVLAEGPFVRPVLEVLRGVGVRPDLVSDGAFCCGGDARLQAELPLLADALLARLIHRLTRHRPDVILVSEPRCQRRVREGMRAVGLDIPVLHPVMFLAQALEEAT